MNLRIFLPEIDAVLKRKLDSFYVESTLAKIIEEWTSFKCKFKFNRDI